MNSPFQNTLGTNFVSSDQECERIRDFLEHAQKEVADLTEELARLDSLRKVLSQGGSSWRNSLTYISRWCRQNPVISGEEAPLLLCQICRSWRRIALTTPRIWAAIHIVVPDQSQLQRLMDRVAIWFERSGVVPLEISVALSKTCLTIDISPLYSALVTVSRRWKSLEIPLSDDDQSTRPTVGTTGLHIPAVPSHPQPSQSDNPR
ncbi:hypothetical protein B0H13DRAFT_2656772 [Mycena leptocephala]|nr:hypothetical protein B0H13DRAFT_2656772 [Mycena leptocephala]